MPTAAPAAIQHLRVDLRRRHVLVSLALADHDFAARELGILHTQPQYLEQAHARTVQQPHDEPLRAGHAPEHCTNLVTCQDHRGRAHGFWILLAEEVLFVPFAEFPRFRNATIGALTRLEWPSSNHLYWPDLDIDLAVESFRHPEQLSLAPRVDAKPFVPVDAVLVASLLCRCG